MPKVLTTGSSVICGHGATASLSSSAKLTVQGEAVLLENEYSSWTFQVGCAQTDSSKSQKPCAIITEISGGQSSKLTVNGISVLIDTLSGLSDGNPGKTDVSATASQDKLEAI
jgi:hypothetical protein